MKKKVDKTPIECKLCNNIYTVAGLRSHIKSKHLEYDTEKYVKEFGEFRVKQLRELELKKESNFKCAICNDKMVSNKQLMHHLKEHNITWEDYIVKYIYEGKHPLCACGCGKEVKLLRHGKNDKGEFKYAREYRSGHNPNGMNGRNHTFETKLLMREKAIERMKNGNTTFHQNGPSAMEKELQALIKANTQNTDIIFNDTSILSGLELDVVIPNRNLAFEFNGNYFHCDLFKKPSYHLKKTKQCEKLGYRLVHIWECDWNGKRPIITSVIKNLLNKTETRIFARKCTIEVISSKRANSFYEENHIKGKTSAFVHLALIFQDKIMSLMSFSKARKMFNKTNVEGHYELIRFCNKIDTSVIGGASRLLKAFIKEYNPDHIYSYVDRDWSVGATYEKIGFTYIGETDPGYFYIKNGKRRSRYSSQKKKILKEFSESEDLTEYQIMSKNNYYRVWDCGNLKYEWSREKLE